MRIGSIVIHCHEFDRMVTFWQNAFHYVPRRPAKDGWVVLRDPEGKGPNLSFQLREKRRPRRNWMHLDLYTKKQEEEVNRLLHVITENLVRIRSPSARIADRGNFEAASKVF
jgi:hypothetical protein